MAQPHMARRLRTATMQKKQLRSRHSFRRGSLRVTILVVSVVVPFLGYLLGSQIYNWLNQKRNYNGG